MYFKYDNITLYYEKHGDGKKSIIILPGWGETRTTFNYMINCLQNYFTIYIVDYPGFGNSSFPDYDLTIYDYSNLIQEWITSLNIQEPILIGHSFGGRIISVLLGYYQYSYQEVILINSAGIVPKKTIKKHIRTLSYKFLRKLTAIMPKKYKTKYSYYIFSKFASADYKSLPDNMKTTFKNVIQEDLTEYMKKIKARTLLIWGSEDDATPLKYAYKMNKIITDSELIVIQGANHFIYLQCPELINKIILEQLKEQLE